MVEDLGLAGGGVGDEAGVEDIEDILADLLELELNLAAVLLDGGDVLVRALGLLLLLDGRNDAPRGTAGADDVLVGDAEEVALVDAELTAQLSDLLHVGNHLIVALGLLAEAGQEGLAIIFSKNLGQMAAFRSKRWKKGERGIVWILIVRGLVGSRGQLLDKPFTLDKNVSIAYTRMARFQQRKRWRTARKMGYFGAFFGCLFRASPTPRSFVAKRRRAEGLRERGGLGGEGGKRRSEQ